MGFKGVGAPFGWAFANSLILPHVYWHTSCEWLHHYHSVVASSSSGRLPYVPSTSWRDCHDHGWSLAEGGPPLSRCHSRNVLQYSFKTYWSNFSQLWFEGRNMGWSWWKGLCLQLSKRAGLDSLLYFKNLFHWKCIFSNLMLNTCLRHFALTWFSGQERNFWFLWVFEIFMVFVGIFITFFDVCNVFQFFWYL